ncbi:WD repeat-containing protein 74-like [Diadema setosum]|uniref:WD repeat-containing protein 74-like n=1 Tax=Diadema setosum TaxID=31175 RepID=UPI003B3AEF58
MAAHMANHERQFQIWVGAQTGILKGINLKENIGANFTDLTSLEKDKEIVSLAWSDDTEDKVLLGLRNGTVRLFNTKTTEYEEDVVQCDVDKGLLKGLGVLEDDRLVSCQESGLVQIWERGSDEATAGFSAGSNLCRMRQHPKHRNQVATGGKENDLKVWNLERPTEPVFRAKNVRNDFLDLRVPVWVTDVQFMEDSSKIVTCTGHHQVRVYDPSSPQRRPVFDMSFDEYPFISMAMVPGDKSVIVGNTQGKMAEIDLRKGVVGRIYKGFAGSIRDIRCHPTLPLVASCGLDRFLRVHDRQDGTLKSKIYLKSKLNCLLFSSRDFTQDDDQTGRKKESRRKTAEDEDEESEKIWRDMKTISDATPKGEKKRRKSAGTGGADRESQVGRKKRKPGRPRDV